MTLVELIASGRAKADEESDTFIPDAEMIRNINQGMRLIHGKIVQSFNDDYTVAGTLGNAGLFDTVSGQQAYDIPTNLKKLVRVEWRLAGSTNENDWRKVTKKGLNNQNGFGLGSYDFDGNPVCSKGYFLSSNALYFYPVPTTVYQVRLWMVLRISALVNPSDVPAIPEEFHDLISEFASIQCLRKSGETIYKEAMDVFNLELTNMIGTIDHRDLEPETMNITDDEDHSSHYMGSVY